MVFGRKMVFWRKLSSKMFHHQSVEKFDANLHKNRTRKSKTFKTSKTGKEKKGFQILMLNFPVNLNFLYFYFYINANFFCFNHRSKFFSSFSSISSFLFCDFDEKNSLFSWNLCYIYNKISKKCYWITQKWVIRQKIVPKLVITQNDEIFTKYHLSNIHN